jgi:cytochrome c-type biogenesis protein CcmH
VKVNLLQTMRRQRSLLLVLAILAIVAATWTGLLATSATHKTLDQRTQEVAEQLKCPVCQGESVADSPALLAGQMRQVIREQLQSGKSEQQVVQYFVNRYGDQIAWSPPWQGFALLAWLVPIVLLLSGAILLLVVWRDWRMGAGTTDKEQVVADLAEKKALAALGEGELERYQELLERELEEEDLLYKRYRTEAT